MLRLALLVLLLASGAMPPGAALAQVPASAGALLERLDAASDLTDTAEREAALDAIWDALREADRIPFASGDSAVFLWRGAATGVAVAGDHTGWDPSRAPLARIGQGDIWARVERFPPEARLDYKLVLNGSTWVLDPHNPNRQWSGFGPNSELRMPLWRPAPETEIAPGVARGQMSAPVRVNSAAYGADVVYRVYTPAGYDRLADLPVVYATDGHEYADDRLGALRIVLDNLVATREVEPAIVVFIDPRLDGQNRRQAQYVQNQGFAAFVATELVPAIDAQYRTRADRDGRVILGTSLGGLFAAYLGVRHPETFGRLAIQSPAFWAGANPHWWTGPSIYDTVQASGAEWTVHMTTGTINDTEDGARRMRGVMEARGLELTYREVPEGHSWGNWRALLPDALRTLLPARGATPTEPPPGAAPRRFGIFPNPARAFATFEVAGVRAPTRIVCTDSLGREALAVTARGEAHAVRVPLAALAPGVYACTAGAGGSRVSKSLTVAR